MVTDATVRAGVAEWYRRAWQDYSSTPLDEDQPGEASGAASSRHLARIMPRVPVLLIPCIEGRPEGQASGELAALYGSVVQASWSFQLAARAHGLGSVFTTYHLDYEREVAELLGIPYDAVTQVALLPVAHTTGGDFRPARENGRWRRSVRDAGDRTPHEKSRCAAEGHMLDRSTVPSGGTMSATESQLQVKSFDHPDEIRPFRTGAMRVVHLATRPPAGHVRGGLALVDDVGRSPAPTAARPTTACTCSRAVCVVMDDGTESEVGPGDAVSSRRPRRLDGRRRAVRAVDFTGVARYAKRNSASVSEIAGICR